MYNVDISRYVTMDGPGVHLEEDLCRLQRPPAAPQVEGVPGEARPRHGGIKTEQSITITITLHCT